MPTDNHLQHAVIEELGWEPSVASAHIGLTVASGIVTLTGHVESYAQKHDAVEAAVCKIVEEGLDMKRFSTVGRNCYTDEKVSGFHSASAPHPARTDA